MDVFKLLGRIALDNSGAMSGMDETVTKAKDTESKLTKIFKKVGTVVATAFAADKIKEFGNACKDAYAELAAEEAAFAQIMGEYAGTAQKKLEGVADATGAVSTRMTKHMTSLTAKFKGLGFGVEDATDMASAGLRMAADAAAFWDMSLDESVAHLNSFINGSYEGGEAIGLFANDTQMAMYAVQRGLVATTKEWSALDEATKQATRLEYAQNMLEASGAMGQAAKEAGSLANVQANLTESWRKFKAVIGEPIVNNLVIPAMQKLNELMPQITEATKTGIEWISNAFGTVKEAVTNLPETLSSAGKTISDTWTKTVFPAIQNAFKIVFGVELPEWGELKQTVVNWWESDNGIKRGIASVCNWVLNLFGAPANVTSEDVSRVLSDWWTGAKAAVQNACTWVLKLFGAPEETPGEAAGPVTTWWNGVKTQIEKSCPWVLQLFNPPSETPEEASGTLATWWDGAKAEIEKACTWVLKLFGAPEDLTADKAKEVLSDWWTTAKAHVQDACLWVLKLFGAPDDLTADKAQEILSEWWTSAKTHVSNACEWALNLFGVPEDLTADKAQEILSDWWTSAKTHVSNACEWVLNLFKEPKVPTFDEVKTILSEWWTDAKVHVQSACEWALNTFVKPNDMTQKSVTDILKPWWTNVCGLVMAACEWALDWFGAPTDMTEDDAGTILDTWWGKAVVHVQNTCKWVLALFGTPNDLTKADVEGIVGTWWEGATTLLEDVCAWTLNTFGEPQPLTVETVEGILGTWWTSGKALVQNACQWALQLFTEPTEGQAAIANIMNTWWTSVRNVVVGVCGWTLKLFGVPDQTVDQIKTLISTWWNGIKDNLTSICGVFFSVLAGDPKKTAEMIKNWWETVKRTVGELVYEAGVTLHQTTVSTTIYKDQKQAEQNVGAAVQEKTGSNFWSTLAQGIVNGFTSNPDAPWLPGHATGLDYVPFDNYVARLHEGEAVLTRTEAEAWRSGYGDTRRMEAILSNVENLLQVVAQNTGANKQIVLDSGALVGQLAPGMDAQLGTISNRKGRRN